MGRTHRWAAAWALVALAAAGCGDDDVEPPAAAGATSASGTAGSIPVPSDFVWLMVTDVAGLGDQGFNDLAHAGLQQAASDLGGRAVVIESADQAQYVSNLQQAADDGADLIVAVGFALTDAVVEVATANPESQFMLIDSVASAADGTPLTNVRSVTFREQEGAYLAGIVAASMTTTGKLGVIGGMEIPPVQRFVAGFTAGVASVDPATEVETAYIGSFADAAKGRELATSYFNADADIVFEVAGLGGLGAYEAAESAGAEYFIISVDTCKNNVSPAHSLTSATKNVTGQVFDAAESVASGAFEGGAVTVGLAENGVGLCESTYDSLPAEVQTAVEQGKRAILDETVVISVP
jgi:basic membrane protein A and related proteins